MSETKHAVVVLCEPKDPVDRGRMVHALLLLNELKRAGAEVCLVLAGRGVEWAQFFETEQAKPEPHPYVRKYGPLYDKADVRVCNMCAKRFDAHADLTAAGYVIEGMEQDHIALGRLVLEGYTITTF